MFANPIHTNHDKNLNLKDRGLRLISRSFRRKLCSRILNCMTVRIPEGNQPTTREQVGQGFYAVDFFSSYVENFKPSQ